ncbi:Hypothetical predicted protein [Mytilus galloprovincialis]|uniref:Endonuclease/exonuclease/phosphatase domain-containing protein n=1 Tax=Mytilus galloprovincialis TaxID=29158 RepID=A0A8B6DY29_MYTGA|nr:Hypothetical predicted protein [Mytilus galloprovincialis]
MGLNLTNVKVNKAVRKMSQHRDVKNDRKPDIIFVEVDNLDNKRAILKAKATLRSSNKYRDVYVENSIPREKRMLDFNNRTILRAMGKDKEYRTVGGKITRLQNQTPSKYRDDTIGTQQNDNFKGNGGSFNGNTNKRGMNNGHGRGHVRGREFSARSVNAHNFFDVLMEQIYSIPKGNSFYLCGDFNSRLGSYTDFIQGIDQLSERNITDFTTNSYGEIFSEFLSTVNCCVLNGRYPIHDDYTYVSTKGLSVVDYCVVPYESLCHYKNFKVIRASVLCNKSAQPGSFRANHIPDHSVLCWEFETNFDNINEICSIDLSHSAQNSLKQQNNTYVSYDVKNIPSDWMTNNDILDKINMCIDNIQCSKGRQFEVDKLYNNFVEILHSEMNDKLETKVKVLNSTNNRKRRIKKPWWNDKLTNKWNIVCTAERDYVTCKQGSLKQQLRKDFVDKRKDFDKLTQKYKRQYWYRCQEELVNFSDNDTNQFWRRIGQIGIGNERQMRIPNEVTLDDGTISNNLETVLSKWKNSFHSLLNPNVNADYNKVDNCILKENIICIDLDKEITIDEIFEDR